MTRVLLSVSNLTMAQAAKYSDLRQDWGEMTKEEVKTELAYYQRVVDALQVGDVALARFQRDRDALQSYLKLFDVPVETPTPAPE